MAVGEIMEILGLCLAVAFLVLLNGFFAVSYTHLTLPTKA